METVLTILLVAFLVAAVWRKAATEQKKVEEVERLNAIVRGQEAALKLKREQTRVRAEQEAQKDAGTAAKIRDAASAVRFLRESGPAPAAGSSGVSEPEDPPAAPDPGEQLPGKK